MRITSFQSWEKMPHVILPIDVVDYDHFLSDKILPPSFPSSFYTPHLKSIIQSLSSERNQIVNMGGGLAQNKDTRTVVVLGAAYGGQSEDDVDGTLLQS